ncbi:hypothetical protein [Streptomyces sp. NPDC058572]|uniref:hypothetical protein n=1 Tax=Streptomyces sp. NPDC058572 TaxID=3346546 RepID=UPI003656FED4
MTPLASWTNRRAREAGGRYRQQEVDLSPYRGSTVTLTFFGAEAPDNSTMFGIDDVGS